MLASRAYAEQQGDRLRATLDALAAETKWAGANRDEAARLIAEETGLPLDLMRDVIKRADFNLSPLDTEIIAEQQATADLFFRLDRSPKPFRSRMRYGRVGRAAEA